MRGAMVLEDVTECQVGRRFAALGEGVRGWVHSVLSVAAARASQGCLPGARRTRRGVLPCPMRGAAPRSCRSSGHGPTPRRSGSQTPAG